MSVNVSAITKLYGSQKALDQVSMQIEPGEIVGLLGPNGAGKSTLMKILTCFIPPTAGEASVCGFNISDQSLEVRKQIGYLPENNPLYTDLYVREFLRFIAGVRKVSDHRERRISEMIDLTGLGLEQHKKIGALSKGYRQRVGLAQALIHDPKVLILDEPTSGLDPNQLLEIRGLIREIGKTKTVIMSTHIMQEVEAICSRVIIIHKGRIAADDTTMNLQQIAQSKAVINAEFSQQVRGELLMKIEGVRNILNEDDLKSAGQDKTGKNKADMLQCASNRWLLYSEPGTDIRAAVFQFAVDHKLTVLSLHREEQKLEEVFQELTRK